MRVLKVLVLLLRFKKKVTRLHSTTLAQSKVVVMLMLLMVFVLVTLATSVLLQFRSQTLEQLILKVRLVQQPVYALLTVLALTVQSTTQGLSLVFVTVFTLVTLF